MNMLERTARHLAGTDLNGYDDELCETKAQWRDRSWPRYADRAAAVLKVALDPEDEALLVLGAEAVIDELQRQGVPATTDISCSAVARSVIMALKAAAQGDTDD